MADKPNILIIMSDEHAPQYSSVYGHSLVQSPNMERLTDMGVTFDNAYCNSPICGPSRMSFMTGRYIHRIGTYDNGFPMSSDAVTWAHRLRNIGYDVVISGKQHFCGPDQLHGFRTQLARDLHAELWTKKRRSARRGELGSGHCESQKAVGGVWQRPGRAGRRR